MTGPAREYWEARGGWDEEFIEHGPPAPCLYCGADDCEGHSEAYVLAYLEEHPLGAPWEPGL